MMKRGFTLLLAVLISGILLALGFALFNIASKELILSSAARDSQFAFYAADSGIECALYWDAKYEVFATSTTPVPDEITCASGTLAPLGPGGGTVPLTRTAVTPGDLDYTYTTTFSFSLGSNLVDPCVDVVVIKKSYPTRTSIRADGYNTCVTTNPRRLDRAIRSNF